MRWKLCCGALSCLLLLPGLAGCVVAAQQASTPTLHLRSQDSGEPDQPRSTSSSGQTSMLPDDVSGSYHFLHDNESIEIEVQRHRLTGYISQLGDAETDSNTPLTFFFDQTSIDGDQIEFQTRVVHGVWYSFHGTIFRGPSESRDQDGYYILHGTLLEHHPNDGEGKTADETIERRLVNFKSMGQ